MNRFSMTAIATAAAWCAAPVSAATLLNASFEMPEAGSSVVYSPAAFDPNVQQWSYLGPPSSAGVAGNGSPLGIADAPDGDQVAFLIQRGSSASLVEQRGFTLAPGQVYRVTFYVAAIPGFEPAQIRVGVNQTFLSVVPAPTSNAFAFRSSSAFVSLAENRIEFSTFGAGVADSGFGIDAVQFVPSTLVPEPATWALMLGGFGLAGSRLRRQRGQRLTSRPSYRLAARRP